MFPQQKHLDGAGSYTGDFRGSSHIIRTLKMGTEFVPETSVYYGSQLTRLISREDFIDAIFLLA
jgi:hypothetical protein